MILESDPTPHGASGQRTMSSTDRILKGKYPAKAHARRVAEYIQLQGHPKEGVVYLEAQKTKLVEDDDQAETFRQRRPFYYLSGCALPDCYLTYNIPQDVLTLFIPPIDPDSVIWAGLPLSIEEAYNLFDVDKVLPSNELNPHLVSFQNSPATVYAISDRISEHVTFLGFDETEFGILESAIDECRVVKDSYEVALIRKANEISTLAHTAVVRDVHTYKNEREIEATFVGTCIKHGARAQAYHSICATGTSCATLHYIKNYESLEGKLNVLLDAGGEYNCYCADITRTFPISGTWSKESKEVYDIVDEMQSTVFKMLKEGVLWEDCHITAHKVAIMGLKKLGILKGSNEELLEKRISVAFFPHGLGHMLGMDTHDVGGHANYEDKDIMFRYLRVRGTLKAGNVITNEPGLYFCNFIIDPYLEDEATSRYIDKDVLNRYWEVGGVRIEDNVHITKDSYENLTNTPKL